MIILLKKQNKNKNKKKCIYFCQRRAFLFFIYNKIFATLDNFNCSILEFFVDCNFYLTDVIISQVKVRVRSKRIREGYSRASQVLNLDIALLLSLLSFSRSESTMWLAYIFLFSRFLIGFSYYNRVRLFYVGLLLMRQKKFLAVNPVHFIMSLLQ